MSTADAIQARYRESVRPALVDRAQSISAAAVDRRPASGLDTTAQRDADEDTAAAAAAAAAAAEGDEQPAEQRRRRFTAAASLALQKSLDGPQLDHEPSALTAQTLRSLLAKTSAANVSCRVSDTHFTNTHTQSAPRSRQITTPAPHHSVFTGWMPFLPPNQQRQSTEGTSLY